MNTSTHLLRVASLVFVSSFLALSACGPISGFSDQSAASSPGTNDANGGTNVNPGPTDGWNGADEFKGIADDDSGAILVSVDKTTQALIVSLPFPGISFSTLPVLNGVPVSELNGVKLTTTKDADGRRYLAVSIPLKYIIKGATFLPTETLPSGAPVEPFPSGEVPHVALQFPQKPDYRINIYIGTKAVAIFVETPKFSMPADLMFPILSKNGFKQVGFFGYLQPVGTSAGGFYLAAKLPDDVARAISQIMGW